MAAAVCCRLTPQVFKHVNNYRALAVNTACSSALVPGTVGIQLLLLRHGSSFFNKKPAYALWDSVTSVSNQGRKRGRASRGKLMRKENLNKGQQMGESASGIQIPGFNTPILKDRVRSKLQESQEHDADYFEKVRKRRNELKGSKFNTKIAPLLRGYSGRRVPGQQIGAPESDEDYNLEGFSSIVLMEKRTCYVTRTQGKIFRFNVLVVTGNKKGLAGYGVGKSMNPFSARKSARRKAANYLHYFEPYEDRTLWHNFHEEFHSTKITAFQKFSGYGLCCHRVLKSICEVLGIKDMYAKVEGSKNQLAMTRAFFNAISKQKTHQEVADELGHYVVERRRGRYYHTEIKAAPSENANTDFVKDVDFDFKTYFFGGKVPLERKKRLFYENFASYKLKSFKQYKTRNQPKARQERILRGYEKEPSFKN